MKEILSNHRIILVGGPGGVGKTTLSASIGLQCAWAGYRTVVLTVDPARRLAQALGLKAFSNDLVCVPLPAEAKGVLFATMLETQRYFDHVIERLATSTEQKERILSNPLYRSLVENLGGTHEYAAMERLLEFALESDFEKIIIDTPPTESARDLLSAPLRLANFMDMRVFRWFQGEQPGLLKFFQSGTRLAMKLLQGIFGNDFLKTFASFADALGGLHETLQKRNVLVGDILKSEATGFFLVTYPSESRCEEIVAFAKVLQTQGISVRGLFLNRIEPKVPTFDAGAEWAPLLRYERAIRQEQRTWIAKITSLFPNVPRWEIPTSDRPLGDLTSLRELGDPASGAAATD